MHQENQCGCQEPCPDCAIRPFSRNHYFTGKLLVERDFRDEQTYFIDKIRHHDQLLHGWGVICGLKVVQHANPACQNRIVCIEPGAAVDCCGHDIIVREQDCVDITTLPEYQELATSAESHTLQICLRYKECPTEKIPVLYDDCACDSSQCAPNRILESYEVGLIVDPVLKPDSVHSPSLEWNHSVNIAHAVKAVAHQATSRLYVLNSDGTIFPVRTDNHSVLTPLTLPAAALELAVSNDGQRLYVVVNNIPRDLLVFDTADFSTGPIQTLSIANSGTTEVELAVAPAPVDRLIALLRASGEIVAWQTDINSAGAPVNPDVIALAANLQGLAISTDGTKVYSIEPAQHQVQVADLVAKAAAAPIPIPPNTYDLVDLAIARSTGPRMDANGRLLPDTTRFPSAAGTNGFRPLADYIHAQGLKFGVHLMRGIPRQAVADNVAILGTGYHANEINNSTTASWLNLNWGLNMSHPGAQAYLDSVFQLLAGWGIDFVKVDDIAAPTYRQSEVDGYRLAIQHSGRPMVLSLSPGPTPLASGSHVQSNAHMWRIVNDLWDNWGSLDALFDRLRDWTPYRRTGAWPDPDMIPIGRLSKQGPVGSPRYSGLTADEQRTLMTLWAINRAPLMWGGNLTENRAAELALMTNAAVLAVDQNSTNNRQLVGGARQVWAADVPGSTDRYLALFNRDAAAGTLSFDLAGLGIGSATVTDLWSGANLGTVSGVFTRTVPGHGTGLYRLTPQTTTPPPTSYTLTARHSGKLLDVFNASTADGANVVQWAANGQTNQLWRFQDAGGGYFRIVSANSGKCLDVNGAGTADGVRVVQWTCHTATNQQWRVQDLGTGYVQLVARHSNKCLDIQSAATTDGAQAIQWTCGTATNQQWQRRAT